jgi:hypothetical protein
MILVANTIMVVSCALSAASCMLRGWSSSAGGTRVDIAPRAHDSGPIDILMYSPGEVLSCFCGAFILRRLRYLSVSKAVSTVIKGDYAKASVNWESTQVAQTSKASLYTLLTQN